jgi:hypothetical protein
MMVEDHFQFISRFDRASIFCVEIGFLGIRLLQICNRDHGTSTHHISDVYIQHCDHSIERRDQFRGIQVVLSFFERLFFEYKSADWSP